MTNSGLPKEVKSATAMAKSASFEIVQNESIGKDAKAGWQHCNHQQYS
jgi:microcompartment protein CcmL/EutN